MSRPCPATRAHDVDMTVDESRYEGSFLGLDDDGISDGPHVGADIEDLLSEAEYVAYAEVLGRIHVSIFDEERFHGQRVVMGGDR